VSSLAARRAIFRQRPKRFAACPPALQGNLQMCVSEIMPSTWQGRPCTEAVIFTNLTGSSVLKTIDVNYDPKTGEIYHEQLNFEAGTTRRVESSKLYDHSRVNVGSRDPAQTTSNNRPRIRQNPRTGKWYFDCSATAAHFWTIPADLSIDRASASGFLMFDQHPLMVDTKGLFGLGTSTNSMGLFIQSNSNAGRIDITPGFIRPSTPLKEIAPKATTTLIGLTNNSSGTKRLIVDGVQSTNQTTALASVTMAGGTIGREPALNGNGMGRFRGFWAFNTEVAGANLAEFDRNMRGPEAWNVTSWAEAVGILFCHGDSITGITTATGLEYGFLANIFESCLPRGWIAYAYGNSGASTATIEARRNEWLNRLDTTKRNALLLQTDMNDLGVATGVDVSGFSEAAVTNIQDIIGFGRAVDAGLPVAVLMPISRQASTSGWGTGTNSTDWDAREDELEDFAVDMAAAAAGMSDVLVIDTQSKAGFVYDPSGYSSTTHADAIHPNDRGNNDLADLAKPKVQEIIRLA
jgi:hypothetical protein